VFVVSSAVRFFANWKCFCCCCGQRIQEGNYLYQF